MFGNAVTLGCCSSMVRLAPAAGTDRQMAEVSSVSSAGPPSPLPRRDRRIRPAALCRSGGACRRKVARRRRRRGWDNAGAPSRHEGWQNDRQPVPAARRRGGSVAELDGARHQDSW